MAMDERTAAGAERPPWAEWLGDEDVVEIGVGELPSSGQSRLAARHRLQDIADYRAALRDWFGALAAGGRLLILVPHAFLDGRALSLPSGSWPRQKRLYSPSSLLREIEEALPANSYRVRWAGDDDIGYDYAAAIASNAGARAVGAIIERIVPPDWDVEASPASGPGPGYAFEAERTRVERQTAIAARRILILKLDHLGDFVMGVPALERARDAFPEAEITLVVGSWNLALAEELGIADRIVAFDAFPRNSAEERPDVRGRRAIFDALLPDKFDIAIDLRTDRDTRFLLDNLDAEVKAGLGTRAEFPFLDIFLPVVSTRQEWEIAREDVFDHSRFSQQAFCTRLPYRTVCPADAIRNDLGAIMWGPFLTVRPGRYIFDPRLEVDTGSPGSLVCDIGLDAARVAQLTITADETPRLAFTVEREATFEFRIWAADEGPSAGFSFYGGRLIREGAASVLHQAEYLCLLVELVAMRVRALGVLREGGAG